MHVGVFIGKSCVVVRVELNENLDNIDADLESLKELLASGQYNLDAETLLGVSYESCTPWNFISKIYSNQYNYSYIGSCQYTYSSIR